MDVIEYEGRFHSFNNLMPDFCFEFYKNYNFEFERVCLFIFVLSIVLQFIELKIIVFSNNNNNYNRVCNNNNNNGNKEEAEKKGNRKN